MRRTLIVKALKEGGRIINSSLVLKDNTVVQGKNSTVTAAQIERVIQDTGAKLTVGYDKTRTVKL